MNNYEFEATEEGSRTGFRLNSDNFLYLYALCADMVVQRGGNIVLRDMQVWWSIFDDCAPQRRRNL